MTQMHARGIKYMDLQEFIDKGYLQEANRYFFHPMGLSLEIEFFDKIPVSFKVWDFREDKEGMLYGKVDDPSARLEKTKNVANLAEERYEDRVASLGYWVQPPGGEGFVMPHINDNIPIAPGSSLESGIRLAAHLEKTGIGAIQNVDLKPKQSINGPSAQRKAQSLLSKQEEEKPRSIKGQQEEG